VEELWYEPPMSLEAARERLLKDVAEFLEDRKGPDPAGGWTEVTKDELHDLARIVNNLIVLKWARDVDGDLPIAWDLYDKTRDDRVYGLNLPRDNPGRCVEMLADHLVSVSRQLDIYVRIREAEKKRD
jgi:hypothetical protein